MERKPHTTAPSPGQLFNGQGVRRISRLNIAKSKFRIATWNVRSLYAAGKFDNVIKEASRLRVGAMGISELRWPDSRACQNEHGTLYYSGSDPNDPQHRNGVGVFVSFPYNKNVVSYSPITDRIILIQMQGQPFKINIIQIYAPTSDKRYDREVDNMYELLNKVLGKLSSDDLTLILGDYNAKIGQGRRSDLVGDFGLGSSNHRGDRLFEFCQENDMVITNTWFKLPKRRLYTWMSPAEVNDQEPIRNQIDYILVNKRFRNSIKRVTTYPGADIGSDHVPLVADIKLKLKLVCKKRPYKSLNLAKLDQQEVREMVQRELNDELGKVNESDLTEVGVLWDKLKNMLNRTCNRHLQTSGETKKKRWMTSDILILMERRRQVKNNKEEYKRLQKIIKSEIKRAKEGWMREMCREMEELEKKHDNFRSHKKLKEIAGIYKKPQPATLLDSTNTPIVDEREIRGTWEKYINELFHDDRPPLQNNEENMEEGPEILNEEVLHAIHISPNGKSPGPDQIPTEILKLVSEGNISQITKLFNLIYNTGVIPDDWLRSTFVTIPKKPRPKKCSDYRLISLMSHLLKTFLRIIHARIRRKCEFDLDDAQMGFRNAFGTREALFGINVLLQKCRDQRKEVFACFIDYEKAFDRVLHSKLISMLREVQLDSRDIRIIENLYWGQTAEVRIEGMTTSSIQIQRGVRQGCILSPLLFNLYSDRIFKEALENVDHGVRVNGVLLNTIRYADDTVIICDKIEGLQELLNKISTVGTDLGLNINISKTKLMIFSRDPHRDTHLFLNNSQIERVERFRYLGSILTEQLDPDIEIKCRIETARNHFLNMRTLFCNDNINLKLRQRMVKCYIWSVVLYGAESWTLKVSTINRLESFEMWTHRRMLRIPWTDLVTNEDVLRRARTGRELLTTIKCRKIAYLGHILRGDKYRLLQLIMKGKIEGRRGVGRKQMSWLNNIRSWTGIQKAGDLFRMAENRDALSRVIANVRGTGQGT